MLPPKQTGRRTKSWQFASMIRLQLEGEFAALLHSLKATGHLIVLQVILDMNSCSFVCKPESRFVPPNDGSGVAVSPSFAEPAGGCEPPASEAPVFLFDFFFLGLLVGDPFEEDNEAAPWLSFEPDVDRALLPCQSQS